MRRHPVILGVCILILIGIVFFALTYALTIVRLDTTAFSDKQRVGVVRIDGVIADSEEIIEQIEEFTNDEAIRAVVIRINSPGGGVAPSQEIYQAVCELRKKKKIVASMGSVAASGGYLIATAADRIVANPGSITGSISAVMHFADIQELMRKVGVRTSVIKSGKFKDIGSPAREMTFEEKRLLKGIVDDIYDQIIRTISENRRISLESVKAFSDGRIFSGRQALNLKLVDQLGGLQDAVLLAGKLAGIEKKPDVVYAIKKKSSFLKYLLESVTSVIVTEIQRRSAELTGAQYLLH